MNNVAYNHNTDKAVKGSGYGGLDATCGYLTNNITTTANTNLNGTTAITSKGNQEYYADTATNLKDNIYVLSVGGITDACAYNVINLTSNNTIKLADTASLLTKSENADIVLGANDRHEIVNNTITEAIGAVGVVVLAKNKNNITRNNTIDVSGIITSYHDVNMYAGKGSAGENGLLNLESNAEAYNKTGIPFGGHPSVTNTFNQTNTVKVNTSGSVAAVRNVNLYADAGKEVTDIFSEAYTSWGSKGGSNYVASTDGDKTIAGKTATNTVQVEGLVVAGAANVQNITIGLADTSRTDIVVLTSQEQYDAIYNYVQKNGGSMDKYVVYVAEKKAGDPDYYRTIDELITLTGDVNDSVYGIDNSVISSFVNVNEFKIGSRDYGLSILARMNELDTLMGNYADNPDSAAYKGFEAEYNTLKQRLTDAGVINSDGSLKTIVVSYVEVPNLSSHGGNVNVTTDNFYSSSQAGKVVAKGSPTITINNNTSLAMNINDVIVGDKGGQIIYNDKVMDPGTSTAIEDINAKLAEAIKTVNTDNSKTVTKAYSAVGGAGQITIKGNYNNTQGLNYLYTYVDKSDGETKTINDSMPVKADIIINGTVNANDGSVYIRSAYHDITIEGKSATDNNAVVTGKTVQLIADSGSVSQGYVDNIVNIGGNPHDQYESKTTGLNDGLNNISNSVYVSNSATVAGGSVIISAADINVNGTVQSGYEKYYVDISTDTALNKSDFDSSATGTITVAQRMQQIADNNGGRAISDEAVIGNPNYLLVAGSSVKRSDGSNIFDYRVAVYYNPSTDKILLPNVESKGGQVYLTGNISSTGNGQINCLDGASDITVNVNVNKELVVGDLITNDVTGTVRITDTNQRSIDGKNVSIVTEYTRNDDGTVNAVSKYLSDKEYVELTAAQMEALGITSSSYAPKEGLRYNWTGGSKTSSYQIYRATWYNKWWGASSSKSEYTKYLAENESTAENLVSSGSSTDPKSRGDFIGTVDGYTFNNNSDVYDIIWQHKDGTSTTEIIKHREWSQGYLNCHHYTEDTWKVSTSGTIDTYTYSVKADQKIGINFIGHADGASEVRVTSAQNDITLTGNLGNVTLYENKDNAGNLTGYAEKGTVNITANNASISQTGGSIYGERVNLLAKENIENIDLTLGDAMKLEVKNIASVTADGKTTTTPNDTEQDISITAHSNKQAAGNLIISKIGSVNITADGETMAATTNKASITNLGNTGNILTTEDGIIVADRIDLVSQNGSIDVRVRAAQESYNADPLTASINATAQKDITLTQIGVDDIAGGNMRIGTIYAKDGDVTINVADGSVVDALPYNDLASASENTLIKKWLQAGLIDDDKASAEAQAQSTALQAEKTLALQDTEEVIALRRSLNDKNTELTKYQKQQALCESDPEKYAEYSGAATKVAEINSEITQLNTQISQLTQDAGTYETWSKEALLYSIQNSIINPESGDLPTTSSKAPNVRGNNITLNVKDSAGVLDANTIEMTIDTLGNANVTDEKSGMTGMEDLKLLSQTDASNVVWNSNTGIITINKKLPIGVQLNAPGKDEQGNDTAIGKIIVANFENTDKNVAGDIYLEGRVNPAATEEKNVTKDINIGLLAAEGDVSVTSLGKITHEPAVGDAANIYGKSLYIAAAEGSIGELDNSLLVVLNGGNKSLGLSAIAPDGIYIRDIGAYYSDADNALWLKNISTQGNIEIAADKSIYQLTNDADIPYYLRIEESDSEESHSITLVSESGNVGQAVKDADGKVKYDDEGFPILTSYTETDADGNEVTKQSEAIHILNSNNAVIVRAAQNVYVEGITSSNDKDQPAEGVLKLTVTSSKKDTDGNYLNLENVGVYVNGELKLAGDINANDTISLDTVKALTIDEGDALTAATIKIRSQESVTTESKLTATNDVVMVAGTDLTVNDVVQAGNDVTLKADDNIYVYSEIGADNDAMLTAGDKITTNAEITAGNDAILEAEKEILVQKAITATGDVEIESAAASITTLEKVSGANVSMDAGTYIDANEIAATNDVNLKAGTYINTKAPITAGNDVNITAVDKVIADDTITATSGSVNIKSTESSIETKKDVTAGKDVSMNAATSIDTNKVIAGNDVTLSAGTTITTSGAIDAGNNASLIAEKEILVKDIVDAVGDVNITSNSSSIVTEKEVSGQNVVMDAGTSVDVNKVTADKDAYLKAGTNITNNDVITAGQDAILEAENAVNVEAKIDATRDVIIDAGTTITTYDVITAGNDASLTAINEVLVQETITATGDVEIESTDSSITTLKDVNGKNVSLDAGTYIDVNDITATEDVNLNAGTYIDVKGKITANDDVTITAGDKIIITDIVKTNGDVTIASTGSSIETQKEISGNNVSMDAKTTVDAAAITTVTDVNLKAGESMNTNGAIAAGNDVKLTAGTFLNVLDKIDAHHDVIINAGTEIITQGVITANHDARITAVTKLTNNEEIITGNDTYLNAGTYLDINKKVTSYNDAVLSAANDININDLLSANENIALQAKQGTVYINADILADTDTSDADDGTAYIKAGQDIVIKEDISAPIVCLVAGHDIYEVYDNSAENPSTSGTIATGELIAISTNKLDLGSKWNYLEKVSLLNDNEDDSLTNVITLGNGGDAQLDVNVANLYDQNCEVHGYIQITNYASGQANDVVIHAMAATKDITVTNYEGGIINDDRQTVKDDAFDKIASSDISSYADRLEGNLTAGGNVTLTANGNIVNKGDIKAGENVTLTAKIENAAANIINDGNIDVGNYVEITASGYIENSGKIVATGSSNGENAGKITLRTSNENLNVDSFIVNKGDMTAKDDILVVSESDDVVNSGNFTTTGDSANIKITAGDDLANSGNMTVKTGGYINIIADDNVLNVGKMMTGDGDVDIISWGGTIFNSDAGDIIAIKGDITLLAGGNTGKYISAVKLTKEEIADSTSVIEQFTGYRIVESDTDSINDSIKDGSVYNQGDLFAYNSLVKLVSDSADVYNFDDLSAVNGDTKYEGIAVSIGSIELIAKQGGVYNSKDLIATTIDPEDDAHILIEANDGLANISYNIIADDDITMISHSGSIVNSAVLQSAEGNVLLEAECGNVFNQSIGYDGNEHGGDIVALNGNVSLIAGSKLDTAQEYSPSTFTIDGQSYTINPGTVINNGDILALGDESTITLKAHTGDVYNNDDFTTILKSDGTSDAYVDAEGNSYYQALGGSLAKGNYLIPVKNLVISAENGLVNTSKDLISTEGSISVTAKTGLSNFANNIYAQNDITLRATDGDVITSSVIESISGDINLISDNGNLINKQGGDLVTLGGNVNMNAGAETDNNLYYIGSTSKNISKIENVESYVVTRYYNAGTADNPDWQLITTDTAAPEDLTAVKTIVNYTTSDGNSETLEFSDDVAVFRNGSVVNYGDIIAIDSNGITGEDGSINLSSAHGNVYNYDDFNKSTNSSGISETYLGYDGQSYNVATGNISLTSPEGEVFNSKKLLVALGDVTIAAAKGMDSFGDTIYAGNNINLIATDGDLVNNAKLISIEGDVNLTANNGTVVNMLGGDIIAIGENGNGGSVNLYAGANEAHDPSINYVDTNGNKGSVVISDEQFQAGNIIVANKYYYPDGSTEPKVIDDTFDIKQLSNTEQASIVTILGFITDDGNLVYDNNISVTDSLGNAVQLVDITITTSEGTQTVKGVQKDIEAYRQGDVVNRGDIVALGSEGISIVSEHSNVTNYDNFAKLDGKDAYEIKGEEYFNDDTEYHQTYSGLLAVSDINLHADEGYIYNGQDIRTAGSVNISSEASLTVGINFGDIEAGEDINIHSNENVNIKNTDLTAGNDINLDAGNNLNVDNSGVNAGNDANLSAGNNANISDTDVNAENNASITAGNDANVSDVNVYAGNDASIAAGNDATINGSIYAGNDASIDAGNDATINGSIDAGNDASIKAGNDANVDAAINATNDASIIADNGNANINGTIDVGRDAYIYAGDELDMNATINSANNTSMIADGDIKINGDVTAQDGVITVASENGDISGNGSLTARQDDASTINGSISVTTTYGNVDLTEVDLLAAGIGNGGTITVAVGEGGTASEAQEIELGKIDGNRVVVINENTNSDSSVKLTDTTVSDFLVVEAENGDLGKITRRDDSEGTLNLAITGVNGGTMNSNIDMDMEDDLRFHALNVSNATINTTGTLDIDRLHTTDKIQANGLGFTTVIYGSKLDNTDPSNSVYVDTFSGTGAQFDLNGKDLLGYNYDPKTNAVNAITNSLINSAASGKNHADNSMYLHTFASNYQDSNGLLIFKTPSYYIKNQRFTLEDLSRNEDDNDVLRADNDNPAVDL